MEFISLPLASVFFKNCLEKPHFECRAKPQRDCLDPRLGGLSVYAEARSNIYVTPSLSGHGVFHSRFGAKAGAGEHTMPLTTAHHALGNRNRCSVDEVAGGGASASSRYGSLFSGKP